MPRSPHPILPAAPDDTLPPYEERDTIPSPPPPSAATPESHRPESGIRDTLPTPLVPPEGEAAPVTERAPAPKPPAERAG